MITVFLFLAIEWFRFNASDFLERSQNGRIVFVGDSIGRNQWESLMCMLSQAIPNKSEIYEVNGNPITKHKGFLSMRFPRQNLTVEYHRTPFLVVIGRPPDKSPKDVKTTVRVDEFNWQSKRWVGSDVLVFNSGHWWNEDKTVLTYEKSLSFYDQNSTFSSFLTEFIFCVCRGCYFEEGRKVNKTMGVMEAFEKSLKTWKSWVLEKLDPEKSYVFFRSYSPVHYRLEHIQIKVVILSSCETRVFKSFESFVVTEMGHGNRVVYVMQRLSLRLIKGRWNLMRVTMNMSIK